MNDRVEIYTDGACSGNPGPGGWAAILVTRGREKEISGYEPSTTNNRMELTAAIAGLNCLNRPCRVQLVSDSAYLISAFTLGWIENWQRRAWRNSGNDPVSNRDLWQALLEAAKPHRIEWVKIAGHSGHPYNTRCDALAVGEINCHRETPATPASIDDTAPGKAAGVSNQRQEAQT